MLLGQATRLLRRIRFPSLSTSPAYRTTRNVFPFSLSEEMKYSPQYGSGGYTRRMSQRNPCLWILICGHAGILLGINANPVFAKDIPSQSSSENDIEGAGIIGLRKVEDGSVISNIHTSKWRVFTDKGRDLSLQGKLDEAERYFFSALQEAKEGFGETDPHVASACNNLAELYRVKKEFVKAEPLYLEAIKILEESFGSEDIRVGAAFRNLGQFYLVQRKLDEAHVCYERALKIQGRVLGHDHADYSDTMYHLGTVLYLQGKEKDSEALIQNSIRILEEGGQGESLICLKRLRYLSQVYLKSNHPAEAENVQRKILHIMELSKGWNSLDTIVAAEGLALTLQSVGNLKEAWELLERCLDARKTLLSEDHIQIGANMLHIARVAMLNSNQLRKLGISGASEELEKAKDLLDNSIRIARRVLDKLSKQKGNLRSYGAPGETRKDARVALIILLQSLNALGRLQITKQEDSQDSQEHLPVAEAENALFQCISTYKEFETVKSISDSPEVKAEYLSCLKHLSSLMRNGSTNGTRTFKGATLQNLEDEIKCVESEISPYRKRKN
ncbi:kinesin light chain 3 isoform X1 [Juglans microcarpa x Juglans regia]|uniref:kinesin light chain 3 isoform X1 n=1 Tax=Juglans microcarpa x Juglans regia TaxID=2249226 RepID=UPI001B7EC676|nr:kinesin light chain 3 isoform X1 [Juglans microcarpa x Juglans regia]